MVLQQAPPHDPEAEATVVAAILVDDEAISRVGAFLHPQDFFQERHAWMYEAALALWDRREAINQVTLAHELARRGRLEDIGGHTYISQIVAELPTAVGMEFSGKIVERDAIFRRMIEAAGAIARIGYEGGPHVGEALGKAEALLLALRGGERLRDFVPLRALLESFLAPPAEEEEGGRIDVVRTGFADLDTLLSGGLKVSDLAVLAARPSAGKSALALAISRNFAIGQGGKVGMFSLEMAAEQVAQRLVAAEAGVESQRLALGRHTDEEQGAISRAIGALSQAEVFIDDTPGLTVAELRAKARRLTADIGLDLIVVDHMQLIHSGFGYESNRVAEMSYISRALKELARELRVPVLALSQLSRAVEARQPHVPLLSDLRESGAIEQDADVVLFIYREDMYMSREVWEDDHPGEPGAHYPAGVAQIIVAKHRNGPTGAVHLRFVRNTAKFEDLLVYDDTQGAGAAAGPDPQWSLNAFATEGAQPHAPHDDTEGAQPHAPHDDND